MNRPQPDEFAPYYQTYIDTVSDDVLAELKLQSTAVPNFLRLIDKGKANYAYAPGKWTLKELIGHVIDTERIMAYRLLHIARKDQIPLPGFDENYYAANSSYASRDLDNLIDEFEQLRLANLFLYQSLTGDELERSGLANGHNVSVRALLFIIAGHVNHHKRIVTERYM
ncbi:DinB family protein (plasmid) [Pedobacter sp. BS3]|uniref:DinB family protein n=1 Tax=Pedobacter sp. BS3 TaxID=2567937 RepID=UPI0011EE0158|nr:DinB family protein [Pedobacter sp. BS3]TZF85645.1 DinB family protein [Pedobacter sp. BS3]